MDVQQTRRLGRHYGRAWRHDPWAFARQLGADVHLVDEEGMRATAPSTAPAPGRYIAARVFLEDAFGDRPQVYVLSTMSREDRRLAVAHECGHISYPNEREECIHAWAEAFVAQR